MAKPSFPQPSHGMSGFSKEQLPDQGQPAPFVPASIRQASAVSDLPQPVPQLLSPAPSVPQSQPVVLKQTSVIPKQALSSSVPSIPRQLPPQLLQPVPAMRANVPAIIATQIGIKQVPTFPLIHSIQQSSSTVVLAAVLCLMFCSLKKASLVRCKGLSGRAGIG